MKPQKVVYILPAIQMYDELNIHFHNQASVDDRYIFGQGNAKSS